MNLMIKNNPLYNKLPLYKQSFLNNRLSDKQTIFLVFRNYKLPAKVDIVFINDCSVTVLEVFLLHIKL